MTNQRVPDEVKRKRGTLRAARGVVCSSMSSCAISRCQPVTSRVFASRRLASSRSRPIRATAAIQPFL